MTTQQGNPIIHCFLPPLHPKALRFLFRCFFPLKLSISSSQSILLTGCKRESDAFPPLRDPLVFFSAQVRLLGTMVTDLSCFGLSIPSESNLIAWPSREP